MSPVTLYPKNTLNLSRTERQLCYLLVLLFVLKLEGEEKVFCGFFVVNMCFL